MLTSCLLKQGLMKACCVIVFCHCFLLNFSFCTCTPADFKVIVTACWLASPRSHCAHPNSPNPNKRVIPSFNDTVALVLEEGNTIDSRNRIQFPFWTTSLKCTHLSPMQQSSLLAGCKGCLGFSGCFFFFHFWYFSQSMQSN